MGKGTVGDSANLVIYYFLLAYHGCHGWYSRYHGLVLFIVQILVDVTTFGQELKKNSIFGHYIMYYLIAVERKHLVQNTVILDHAKFNCSHDYSPPLA